MRIAQISHATGLAQWQATIARLLITAVTHVQYDVRALPCATGLQPLDRIPMYPQVHCRPTRL